MNYRSSLSR